MFSEKSTHSKVVYEITQEHLDYLVKEMVKDVLSEIKKLTEPKDEAPIMLVEVCKLLGLKPPTVYKRVSLREKDHNYIPHYKSGGKLYFYKSEILAHLNNSKSKSATDLKAEAETYLQKGKRKK